MTGGPWVRVHTLDGSYVDLARVEAINVADLVEQMRDEDAVLLSFDLDDGRSQVHVPLAAVARVDVDWEISRWRRLRSWFMTRLDRLR